MKRNALMALLAAAIEMQVVTGCRAVPEMQRFVLEDGTVIVADTGADWPSKETTEIFKRLYAAVGSDADIDDAQTYQLALAKMLDKVVQTDNPQTFRGIQKFYVIPFSIAKETSSNYVREVVYPDDPAFKENIQLSSRLSQYDFTGTDPAKGYYSGGSFINTFTFF